MHLLRSPRLLAVAISELRHLQASIDFSHQTRPTTLPPSKAEAAEALVIAALRVCLRHWVATGGPLLSPRAWRAVSWTVTPSHPRRPKVRTQMEEGVSSLVWRWKLNRREMGGRYDPEGGYSWIEGNIYIYNMF